MPISDKCIVMRGKNYDIYTEEQVFRYKQDLLDDKSAIEIKKDEETSIILPVRSDSGKYDKPGIYIKENQPFAFLCYPESKEDKELYETDSSKVINWRDSHAIQDNIDKVESMNKQINQYLETNTDSTNVYRPPLLENDTTEMRGLKQCIIEKGIEIDKYAERFGVNFPNDKRKLKDSDITSYLLKRMCTNFDIEVDMVFRDASPDVPNPMGKTIRVNLVPGVNNNVIIEENK